MDRFGIVLVISYNDKILCFKKNNSYTFPILWVDSLFDINSMSVRISRYLNSKNVAAYFIKGRSNIIESRSNNIYYSYQFVECEISKMITLEENEKLIPKYFLNKRYFNSISKIYIAQYNKNHLFNDIPLDARVLFSEYYFESNEDYYAEIRLYTKG